MTRVTRFGVALAALAMVGSMAVHAQSSKPAKGDAAENTIKGIDRNGNGCVDLEEGRNYSSRRFHALDKNGDGMLDLAEAPLLPGETSSSRPVSLNDWADAYPVRFAAVDTDGNGCLSPQEMRTFMPDTQNGGQ